MSLPLLPTCRKPHEHLVAEDPLGSSSSYGHADPALTDSRQEAVEKRKERAAERCCTPT